MTQLGSGVCIAAIVMRQMNYRTISLEQNWMIEEESYSGAPQLIEGAQKFEGRLAPLHG